MRSSIPTLFSLIVKKLEKIFYPEPVTAITVDTTWNGYVKLFTNIGAIKCSALRVETIKFSSSLLLERCNNGLFIA